MPVQRAEAAETSSGVTGGRARPQEVPRLAIRTSPMASRGPTSEHDAGDEPEFEAFMAVQIEVFPVALALQGEHLGHGGGGEPELVEVDVDHGSEEQRRVLPFPFALAVLDLLLDLVVVAQFD